jgi:hypothetical protein
MIHSMAKKFLYGLNWNEAMHPVEIEFEMCRRGGLVKKKDGSIAGNGAFWHWKHGQELIWPEKKWHRWNELELRCYIENKYIGEMGCAAAGKTESAASNVLFDWYLWPWCTTCLISSTDLKSLDLRAWGTIKRYHRAAKKRHPNIIPGHLIEGHRTIINDERKDAEEGRDFKNGLVAVPCKRGETYIGMGSYVGIHNKRIRLLADELNLMPKVMLDSTSNLSKCEDFRMVGIGQPSETTTAHGDLCEPHTSIGGWEGGVDQTGGTKTWKTKWPGGICIQLPGSDSPNFDVPEDAPIPFPFLITPQQIKDDAEHWGTDDWHYMMMVEGRMPRGQGSHRFLTRQKCEKFLAFDQPVWRDSNIKKIAFLDAGYGGDRCVFGEFNFGRPAESLAEVATVGALASQESPVLMNRQLLALVDTMIIPVKTSELDLPEDQIVKFVVEQCEHRGIPLDDFFYDPGLRTKLTVAFSRITGKIGNPIDCGGKATDRPVAVGIDVMCKDYYSKYITELWGQVALTVESGQFRGMTKEVMWEFCAREWKKVGGGKMEAESKVDMKAKTGRSPDLADAVAIGLEGARQRGFQIVKVGSAVIPKQRTSEAWKRRIAETSRKAWHAGDLDYAA